MIGIKLNTSGGVIKTSKDQLLRQSSSVANTIRANFSNGNKKIAGSYVEFAERSLLPEFRNLKSDKLKESIAEKGSKQQMLIVFLKVPLLHR